ncbi:MAG: amino acid ABC transporter permease [Treponema sp.]|nr:amino acid ABC transporter permease [Treponema sp.]
MSDISVLFEGNALWRLLGGLLVSIRVAMLALLFSIPLGVLFGLFLSVKNKFCQMIGRIYLEALRIMPQLVLLFLVYFGFTRAFGWNFSGEVSAVLVFTLWGAAELGDLVRGAISSIPRHQYLSASALALSKKQTYLYIILPQTIRRLVPVSINLATRMIKTTSLIALIGVVEVLKVGQQIIEGNRYTAPKAAFAIYAVIFFLYFFSCWPLSVLGKRLEKKWSL